MDQTTDLVEYDAYIEQMRQREYPMLKDSLYLDHAGTTLYSKTLMERFHAQMMANLYGNPHSMSPSSQRSTQEIEGVRLRALQFFGADLEHFDLVFTANTTAAIKLVMEAFREQEGGFWYGYHADSHTSLVGVRESAKSHTCFESDEAIRMWLDEGNEQIAYRAQLFAYPAQSNMNGRRLPLDWISICRGRRSVLNDRVYTLLDAAAYAPTSQLHLDDHDKAADFTVVSFSKIFGFPDLGALIVKKEISHLFEKRSYFGGGTVDMVLCLREQWHALKSGSIHERLEDGTLPVHNILALGSAIATHIELFQSQKRIAEHTAALTQMLYEGLRDLRHGNGYPVAKIYCNREAAQEDFEGQGPTIAFNLRDCQGRWVSNTEVEKLASVKDIHLRTGGLCNPGGLASCLDLAPWEMRGNFSAGFRCGSENDVLNGKPTGMIRVSIGAMSTRSDVTSFTSFLQEFFVGSEEIPIPSRAPPLPLVLSESVSKQFYVESLTVYPIKSCAGWRVPYDRAWDVRPEGLAWDREWCIVKQDTGAALSQKAHPRMALIRPILDFDRGVLRVTVSGWQGEVSVPLSDDPRCFAAFALKSCNTTVCGDSIEAQKYTSAEIADFFTRAVGVPCILARFPAATQASPSIRHSKAHLKRIRLVPQQISPILLSNESPILTISRSSLNRLNENIKSHGGKAAHPNVFRANIVLAENPSLPPGQEQPWAEDHWEGMRIGNATGPVFDFLGGCRRCQMVCIDQVNGEKNQEPFVTLAKTRRFCGRVLFGVHTSLRIESKCATIKAGNEVQPWLAGE